MKDCWPRLSQNRAIGALSSNHRGTHAMSVITTTNGKQRNVLNGKDRFYLQRWVADNAKKLDGLTPEEAATKVFNTIGIHVTPTNLLGARRATGVKFKLRTQPKP